MNGSNYNNNALTLYLMDRCAIFIDGGYLEEVLIKKGKPKIDFKKLSEKLSNKMTLLRTYYYTAMPHQIKPHRLMMKKYDTVKNNLSSNSSKKHLGLR